MFHRTDGWTDRQTDMTKLIVDFAILLTRLKTTKTLSQDGRMPWTEFEPDLFRLQVRIFAA